MRDAEVIMKNPEHTQDVIKGVMEKMIETLFGVAIAVAENNFRHHIEFLKDLWLKCKENSSYKLENSAEINKMINIESEIMEIYGKDGGNIESLTADNLNKIRDLLKLVLRQEDLPKFQLFEVKPSNI